MAKFCIYPKINVTEEMIQELTPYRRQSFKGNNLSAPQWFIKDYENRVSKEYRPLKWDKLSEQEKADEIVKMRYSSLLANKIMNKIKDEPIEHNYQLFDGFIVGHNTGNKDCVDILAPIYDTDIHNHPILSELENAENKELAEYIKTLCPDLKK